ncbi:MULTISPECIES: VOC family protein [Nostocales]|uniref:Glyoxalase n=3 Tax=Nostocales TaxID=1161 RepID=A0A0C1N8L6_9CYAN|nr:VOC family protein [Tolypothrix bouteillei]KAF3885385.1 glyoxalase [Tolypothrix bouteillei VB521301]
MEDNNKVFHVAIPCKDLDEAENFYVTKLRCKLGRKYSDRITLNFFSSQLVCHLYPEQVDSMPQMYPRHFGVIFQNKEDFNTVLELAKQHNLEFVQEVTRKRQQEAADQLNFYLKDPSNNVIQFKLFLKAEMVY